MVEPKNQVDTKTSISGQNTIIPKPELRGFWKGINSLTKSAPFGGIPNRLVGRYNLPRRYAIIPSSKIETPPISGEP